MQAVVSWLVASFRGNAYSPWCSLAAPFLQIMNTETPLTLALSLPSYPAHCVHCVHVFAKAEVKLQHYFPPNYCFCSEKKQRVYLAGVSPWLQMHSALWIRTQISNTGIGMREKVTGFCVKLQKVLRGKIDSVSGKEKKARWRLAVHAVDWADQQGRRFCWGLVDAGGVETGDPLRVTWSTTATPPANEVASFKNQRNPLSPLRESSGEKTTLMFNVQMSDFLWKKFDRMMTNGRENTGGWYLFMFSRKSKRVRLIIQWRNNEIVDQKNMSPIYNGYTRSWIFQCGRKSKWASSHVFYFYFFMCIL